MNIKITKEQHLRICELEFKEYIFGSHLHRTNNNNSDKDILRVIKDNIIFNNSNTLGKYLPNIHIFQYDDIENNTQYVYMTEYQFWYNLFSGDGHIQSDIILLTDYFENPLFLCRTYKIIKGYLGLVKRDLKYYDKNEKKRLHCIRGLYITNKLIHNEKPIIDDMNLFLSTFGETYDREMIQRELNILKDLANRMYENNTLTNYPIFDEKDDLVSKVILANNIKEFTY
jgi:hypothetical protein